MNRSIVSSICKAHRGPLEPMARLSISGTLRETINTVLGKINARLGV